MIVNAMKLKRVGDKIGFEAERVGLPPPAADEVTLMIDYCGICGSDIARYRGGAYHYPIVIGHEFAGRVYAPGDELDNMRAAVYPIIPCGRCDACHANMYALCGDYDYYGSRRDGGFCGAINVKRSNLVPIPDGISTREGTMCEPCAVALNALGKASSIRGRRVAVYGAGTIGLLVLLIAKALGAAECFCHDPDEKHMDFACRLGARPLADDRSLDVYVDACGQPSALNDILLRAKPHSEVILVGNPPDKVLLERAAYSRILRGELRLCGSWNSRICEPNDWKQVLELMKLGRLDVTPLITQVFLLRDAESAFYTMLSDEFSVKVMLDCRGEATMEETV